ncbi:MAG TPA: transglutaminase family protein [Stellaceae bacterium]|nr:transglutaminase family protein [Stellaceae bacterium]
MRLSIRHTTIYRYRPPVPYEIQTLRMTPRTYEGLLMLRWQVRGDRARALPSFIDGLGNVVHTHTVNRIHDSAAIAVAGEVETRPMGGLVRDGRETMPPGYFLRRTPLTGWDAAVAALARDGATGASEFDRLVSLVETVRERVALRTGLAETETRAAETLAKGSGTCQDHAHLFIAACRSLGIPARFVSGYVWTGDGTEPQASQAWAEAYVGEIGWVGFDPANGTRPDDAYIRVAVGLDYWSAAPARGLRRGEGEETLSVNVNVAQDTREPAVGAGRQEQ